MKRILTVAGIAAALAAPLPVLAGSIAQAPAEPQVAAPAPAPMMMTRNWTGAYGGLQLGYADLGRDVGGNGALGGLHLGYLQDFGNGFAAGIEGSYNRGRNIDVTLGGVDTGSSLREVLRLGATAGVTTGDFFIYGTAGAARARVSGLSSETGPFAGVGVDYLVTENISVGGQVLYHRFSGFGFDPSLGVSATTAEARVSFRF